MADTETSVPQSKSVPAGREQGAGDPQGKSRLAIGAEAAGTIPTRLVSDDIKFGQLEVPLYEIEAYRPDKEEPQEANDLTPITPMVDATRPRTNDEGGHEGWHDQTPLDQRAQMIERGYVTIWLNGYLWREFHAIGDGRFREVNLAYYAGDDEREATGAETPTILIPRRRRSQDQDVRIGYSYVQWSWRRIERFGGMAYDSDPRVKGRQRRSRERGQPDVAIPQPELTDAAPGQCRDERLDQLPLSQAPDLIRAANQGGDAQSLKKEPDRQGKRAGLTVGGGVTKAMGDYPAGMVLNSQLYRAFQVRERHDKAMFQRDSYYQLFEEGYVPPNRGFGDDAAATFERVADHYSDWVSTVDERFRRSVQGYTAPRLDRAPIAQQADERERNKQAFQIAALICQRYAFEPASRLPIVEPRYQRAVRESASLQQEADRKNALQAPGEKPNESLKKLNRRADEATRRYERLRAQKTQYETRQGYYASRIEDAFLARYLGLNDPAAGALHEYLETILQARRAMAALMSTNAFWDEIGDYLDRPAPGFLLTHTVVGKLVMGLPEHPGGAQAETFLDYESQGENKGHRAYQNANYAVVADLWERLREDDYADYLFPDGEPTSAEAVDDEPPRACQVYFPTQAFQDWLAAHDSRTGRTKRLALERLDRIAAHHLGSPQPGEHTDDFAEYNQSEDDFKVLAITHKALKLTKSLVGPLTEPLLPSLDYIEKTHGNLATAHMSAEDKRKAVAAAERRVEAEQARVDQLEQQLNELKSKRESTGSDYDQGESGSQEPESHRESVIQAELKEAKKELKSANRLTRKLRRAASADERLDNPVMRHLASQPPGRQATLVSLTFNGRIDVEPEDSTAEGLTGRKGVRPLAVQKLDRAEAQLRSLGEVLEAEGQRYVRTPDGVAVPLRFARANSSVAHEIVASVRDGENLLDSLGSQLNQPMAGKLVYVPDQHDTFKTSDPAYEAKQEEVEAAREAHGQSQDELDAIRRDFEQAQARLEAERGKLTLNSIERRAFAQMGTLNAAFLVLEAWDTWSKVAAYQDKDSYKRLLDLVATSIGATATAFELAGVGARRVAHRGLMWTRLAQGVTGFARLVSAVGLVVEGVFIAYQMVNAYYADNEARVSSLALALLGVGLALAAPFMGAFALAFSFFGALFTILGSILGVYFMEGDTEEWLRNSPWGENPFQAEGPYEKANKPGQGMDFSAFAHALQSINRRPSTTFRRQDTAPDGVPSLVVDIGVSPSEDTGGDLRMQLEAKMLASNDVGRVNTELGKEDWSEILPSTPPSASDRSAAATTAWEAARQRVIDATEWQPKTDGAGYRLVIKREGLKRLAKGFIESEGTSRQDATVSLSFRVRTRRQMSGDGDGASGYTLPVPGGPHDDMPDDAPSEEAGWFVATAENWLEIPVTALEETRPDETLP